jgi:hypothetical protein
VGLVVPPASITLARASTVKSWRVATPSISAFEPSRVVCNIVVEKVVCAIHPNQTLMCFKARSADISLGNLP